MSAVNFDIGKTTKATWSIIDPRTTVGQAWAPSVQYDSISPPITRTMTLLIDPTTGSP